LSMKRKHAKVHGQVQGVGFRYFTERTASSMGLTGWVRNEPDGTVAIEAQGDEDALTNFFEKVRKGPTFSDVTDLETDQIDPENGESGFRIKY
ncbi:MAG: acylphosphatase, partial [Candidatus Sumerlaeota bacterium]